MGISGEVRLGTSMGVIERPVTRRRSLLPREHGAYAQLLAPLIAALLVYQPALSGVFLAVAAWCAFLANEPLLVLLGRRGPRLRATDGDRARRRLIVLASIGGAAALGGLALAGSPTIGVAALALVPAIGVLLLGSKGALHSLSGELAAAVALPTAAAPVAVASGVPPTVAFALSAAWSLGFAASVVAVHHVIDSRRRPKSRRGLVMFAVMIAIVVGIVTGAQLLPALTIGVPLILASAVLVLRPPHPRHLREVGVVLVAASTVSIVIAAVVGY